MGDHDELALAIATQADHSEKLDASASSQLAGDSFLTANRIDRSSLRSALERVFAGRVLVPERQLGATYIDQGVKIGNHNTISGSINAGGNQLVLTENSPTEEILNALTEFVSSGIARGFSPAELELLDHLAAAQGIDPQRLEDAVKAGIASGAPVRGRVAQFRDAIMTSTTSGLVVQAIIAAAAAVL